MPGASSAPSGIFTSSPVSWPMIFGSLVPFSSAIFLAVKLVQFALRLIDLSPQDGGGSQRLGREHKEADGRQENGHHEHDMSPVPGPRAEIRGNNDAMNSTRMPIRMYKVRPLRQVQRPA